MKKPTILDMQEEYGDNYRVRPNGALSTKTKKTGDGFWCPVCFAQGRYSWTRGLPGCGICKTNRSDMDEEKISKIMRLR